MHEKDNPSHRFFQDWFPKDQAAEWVRKMIDHHRRTGS
jgi:hypothetical protein